MTLGAPPRAMRQIALLIILFVVRISRADLPVHCLHRQIIGRWTFHAGPPADHPQACGHHTPGEVRDVLVREAPKISGTIAVELELASPDLATTIDANGEQELGWWTMVYDQGFEVRLGGRAYFAFGSVQSSSVSANFYSRCSHTAVGWYHEPLANGTGDLWGCYYGVQHPVTPINSSRSDAGRGAATGFAASASASATAASAPTIVAGSSTGAFHPRPQNGSWVTRAATDDRPDALKYAGLPAQWDWRDVDDVNYVPPVRSQGACGSCYAIAAVAMLESRVAIASGGRERPSLSVQEVLSCSPYSQGCAGGFPYLVGKYLADKGVVADSCFPTQLGEGQPLCAERCDGPTRRWRASDYRYVSGRYGGCSEAAMMREIHERGPIVAGFEARASLYDHGGHGIFSSSDGAPPRGSRAASAFASAGGGSGGAPQAALSRAQRELHQAVEWVEAVESGEAIGSADDSVDDAGMASSSADPALGFGSAIADGFERTNHAVLVVGWGVEGERKYWLAQNTWGDGWGDGGYFKMARGDDDSAFESMAVAVDVEGGLPLPMQKRLSPSDARYAAGPADAEAARAEARRVAAMRRKAHHRPYSLVPDARPPPSPEMQFRQVEEPREPSATGGLYSLLDALAHFAYGG